MTFKLKGSYAPAVEQKSKHAVSVIVLDVPRPPRDNPPPTVMKLRRAMEMMGRMPYWSTRSGPNWRRRTGADDY